MLRVFDIFFFLMIRRPPRSTLDRSSAASDVYKRQEFKSGIEDVTVKLELDIRPSPDHQLSAGIYGISYKFQPKSITINEESKVGDFFIEEGLLDDVFFSSFKVKSLESGVYFEDKWDISTKFRFCLLYTSPSPRDRTRYRMPSSA